MASLELAYVERIEFLLRQINAIKHSDALRLLAEAAVEAALALRASGMARLVVEKEPEIDTGTKQRKYLAELRDQRNRERHDVRAREWARWNTVAAEVWRNDPRLSKNAVANILKQRLNLREAIKTIVPRLKKPAKAG